MLNKNPELIIGGEHLDERGSIVFFNSLNLDAVKRFYVLQCSDEGNVRAWQGHRIERKWMYVISGSFKIVLVKPDNWGHPSENLECQEFILSSNKAQTLVVPGGFASGFVAIEPGSKLMVFSDLSLEDSKIDDYRFNKNLWYKW